jgi:hypothetical protein
MSSIGISFRAAAIALQLDCEPGRHASVSPRRHQVSSLLAVSGATNVAMDVISAQTIRNTETGQVAPAHVISDAAINGLKPPLSAAPTWNPSEAPL